MCGLLERHSVLSQVIYSQTSSVKNYRKGITGGTYSNFPVAFPIYTAYVEVSFRDFVGVSHDTYVSGSIALLVPKLV